MCEAGVPGAKVRACSTSDSSWVFSTTDFDALTAGFLATDFFMSVVTHDRQNIYSNKEKRCETIRTQAQDATQAHD